VPDRLPALRFDTASLAPALRFEACRARVAAWKDLRSPQGQAPADFRLATATWRFGPLALSWTSGPDGAINDRTAAHVRRDLLDHWSVSLLLRGEVRGEVGGEAFAAAPGRPFAYGLHLPHRWARGGAEWVTLFVPRNAAPELAAGLDAARGPMATEAGLAALVAAHLAALPAALDAMPAAEARRAAEATLALLRAALPPAGRGAAAPGGAIEAALRARLLALIRRNLDSVRLDPERLARLAGLSRTRLYEVFEADGGVARAIQRERLRAVCRALADPTDRRPVARVAEVLGMPDPSVFSRAFRREFGVTPSEFRERAAAGLAPLPPGAGAAPPADLADLLRGLGRV